MELRRITFGTALNRECPLTPQRYCPCLRDRPRCTYMHGPVNTNDVSDGYPRASTTS